MILLGWNVVPLSKLYVTPLDGVLTVIVPVVVEHVGCVSVTVGAVGTGLAFMVVDVATDVQPLVVFLVRIEYVLAARPLIVAFV